MPLIKRIVTVIPSGHWPDSATENLHYWLTRPATERVAAARQLRRSSYRRLTRRELPPMRKIVRKFTPES